MNFTFLRFLAEKKTKFDHSGNVHFFKSEKSSHFSGLRFLLCCLVWQLRWLKVNNQAIFTKFPVLQTLCDCVETSALTSWARPCN